MTQFVTQWRGNCLVGVNEFEPEPLIPNSVAATRGLKKGPVTDG
jgi:hypothetical protein